MREIICYHDCYDVQNKSLMKITLCKYYESIGQIEEFECFDFFTFNSKRIEYLLHYDLFLFFM